MGRRVPFTYKEKHIESIAFSYMAFKGPVFDSDRFKVLCRNKSCVNPSHIRKIRISGKKRGKPVKIQPPVNTVKTSIDQYGPFDQDAFWLKVRQQGYHLVSDVTKYRVNGYGIAPIRLAYMIKMGDIPKGYKVVPECDNPMCIDPYHCTLEPYKTKRNA